MNAIVVEGNVVDADLAVEVNGELVYAAPIKNLKKDTFLRRKPDAKTTYTRGEYDRSEKKFWIDDYEDYCKGMLLKGDTVVWIGFTY